MASAESGSLLRGDPVGFCNEPFVELDATARAKAGAVFEHASGDPADVRDSELQRRNASPVDCRFSGECTARVRQRGQGGCDSQDRGDLTDGFGVNDGHLKPFERP